MVRHLCIVPASNTFNQSVPKFFRAQDAQSQEGHDGSEESVGVVGRDLERRSGPCRQVGRFLLDTPTERSSLYGEFRPGASPISPQGNGLLQNLAGKGFQVWGLRYRWEHHCSERFCPRSECRHKHGGSHSLVSSGSQA